jgi:hypothetical protein
LSNKNRKKTASTSVRSVSRDGKKPFEWTKKRKIAAAVIGASVLAAIVFVVIILVMQIGTVRPIKSTDEEAREVGKVAGFTVRYEELRYITLTCREQLDAEFGIEYELLDVEGRARYEAALSSMVADKIKSNYVILSLCEKYGIATDSKAADEYVAEQLQTLVDEELGGSVKKYREWLAENKLTDSFLRLMYKVDYLESKLLDKFVEDKIGIEYDNKNKAEFVDYVMNGGDYVKTIHAFYPHKHPNPQNTAYNAYSRAVAALDNLKAIEDSEARFERMRTEIGKAPFVQGFSVTGSDYYFTYGQMGEKYESEAFSLDIYGVGDLIRTNDGYYVIMRVPMVEDEVQMRVNELLSQYQYATLKRAEDARREELTFEGNEYFDGLKLIDIK